MNGFAKIPRRVMEHAIWQAPDGWLSVFVAVLVMADHQPSRHWDGQRQIELPAGSIVTSLANLAGVSRTSVQQVRDAISFFQRTRLAVVLRTQRSTIITLTLSILYDVSEDFGNTKKSEMGTNGEHEKNTTWNTIENTTAYGRKAQNTNHLQSGGEKAGTRFGTRVGTPKEHTRFSSKNIDSSSAFTKTTEAVRSHFPGANAAFIERLVIACRDASAQCTDSDIARGVQAVHRSSQRTAGLYLSTVPEFLAGPQQPEPEPNNYDPPWLREQRAALAAQRERGE